MNIDESIFNKLTEEQKKRSVPQNLRKSFWHSQRKQAMN